ncbi:MAG: hypothetical protein AAF944_16810 [Bacteroidota bacterium]
MSNYQVVILREAQLDIEETIEWYDNVKVWAKLSSHATYIHVNYELR